MKNKKKLGIKSILAISVIVAIIIVLLLNIISVSLSKKYNLQVDLTSNDAFTLEDTTINYLTELKIPVKIQLLTTEKKFSDISKYNSLVDKVLQNFGYASDNIEVEYVDYAKDPTFSLQYDDLFLKEGDVVISSSSRYKQVETEELFEYSYNSKNEIEIVGSKAEEALLSGVLYVTNKAVPMINISDGHDETEASFFTRLLEQNNFEVNPLMLITEYISSDCDVFLINAPLRDFTEDEIAKLDNFLYNDGKYGKTVLYFAGIKQETLPNLSSFLLDWGISVNDGLVFETNEKNVVGYQPFYPLVEYVDDVSVYIKGINVPLYVPLSRPLSVLYQYNANGDKKTTTLAQFSESSGVRPSNADSNFSAATAEKKGPIPALIRCDKTLRNSGNAFLIDYQSTVMCISSNEYISENALSSSSFANAEFMLNFMNTQCNLEQNLMIQPKSLTGAALNITQDKANKVGILFIVIIPLITLLLGLVVYLRRRNK